MSQHKPEKESKTGEKRYFIREFSNMTGLPQSKIRYYEKFGLFRTKRMENGYRWFSPEDAFRVNAFRTLLQYGFSVEQAIQMLDEKQQTQQFDRSLAQKWQELDREKQLLEHRLRALEGARALLRLGDEPDFLLQQIPDKLYVYASHGRDFGVAGQNSKAIACFVEMLSISNYARIIDTSEFESPGQTLDPSYVSAIPASEEWRLGEYDSAQVHRLRLGECLAYHRRVTRAESVQKESFAPMWEYLRRNGLRLREKMMILPGFLNLDGCGTDVETVLAPVEAAAEK